jgi:dihydroflavonol-4-reductase
MRVVVTGGAGLVGRAVVKRLRDRGDTVVAPVRDPAKAGHLATLGAELVRDDLSDVARLTAALAGADGAVHAAGSYRIGITDSERPAMTDTNVGTTTRFLDAAAKAAIPRIVYVSTINVYGNTHGRKVDETFRRNIDEGFLSWYDRTKYEAHQVAAARIEAGAPVVVVLPSQVYGPGDRTGFGEQLRLAYAGKLPYLILGGVVIGLVHADDLAAGIVAALDQGRLGGAYNLPGPTTTLGEAVALAAKVGGKAPPRLRLPDGLLRVMAPLGGLVGQPNLREVVRAGSGVSYLGAPAKAKAELGFSPRDLELGFRDTFAGA